MISSLRNAAHFAPEIAGIQTARGFSNSCPPGCVPKTCDAFKKALQKPFEKLPGACPKVLKVADGMQQKFNNPKEEVLPILQKILENNPSAVAAVIEEIADSDLEKAGGRLATWVMWSLWNEEKSA